MSCEGLGCDCGGNNKYQPIPGEMDTIDCLKKEVAELQAENKRLRELLEGTLGELESWRQWASNNPDQVHFGDPERIAAHVKQIEAALESEKESNG